MKDFKQFIQESKVEKTESNPAQAKSLIQKAEKRLKYVKDRQITDENADLILEDSYEAITEGLDSFLILSGFKSHSHEASIIYGFEKLDLSYSEANKLNKFRKLRNDSKYRGEDIEKREAEQITKIASKMIPDLKKRFKEKAK